MEESNPDANVSHTLIEPDEAKCRFTYVPSRATSPVASKKSIPVLKQIWTEKPEIIRYRAGIIRAHLGIWK